VADDAYSWLDPLGVETVLSNPPTLAVLAGPTGLDLPPASLIEEEVPFQPGARERTAKILPRNVELPLEVAGADRAAFRALIRTLAYALSPARGAGKLRVRIAGGAARDLTCRCLSGFEGDEGLQAGVDTWRDSLLHFRATDPYWYDTAPQLVPFGAGAGAALFFPFFPIRLLPNAILADVVVTNPGDVEAWPIWHITGPGSTIVLTLTQGTTTQSLELDTTLLGGETITVDTRPGAKTITSGTGASLWATLAPLSALWALPSGASTVRVGMAGSTSASSVLLDYTPRYSTA
jgi:hypothetical protein